MGADWEGASRASVGPPNRAEDRRPLPGGSRGGPSFSLVVREPGLGDAAFELGPVLLLVGAVWMGFAAGGSESTSISDGGSGFGGISFGSEVGGWAG